jgi:hypothetical protein
MSKGSRWAEYSDFSGGEMSDISASLIPDNGLQYAENVFTDKSGRISKRRAIRSYLQAANSNYYNSLGTSDDSESAALQRGYASRFSANKIILDSFYIGEAGGSSPLETGTASTNSDAGAYSSGVPGESFNSFGIVGFPISESGNSLGTTYNALPIVWAGGAKADVGNFSTTSGGTVTVKANESVISFSTLAFYNAFKATDMAGQFFYATVGAGTNQNEYVGKIISQDDAAFTITVTPTPKSAFVGTYYSRSTTFGMGGANFETGGGARPMGANSAVIHQNRTVCAVQGTNNYVSLSAFTPPSFARVDARANTIMWSAITGEPATAANTKSDGLLSLLYAGWPKGQSLTLDTAGITGLVSLDANNLMVLCVDKILMLSGTLGSIVTVGGVTGESSINIRTLSTNIGCAYPKTIQKTSKGVVFSDLSAVYITDGATFVNLMENKIQLSYGYFASSIGIYGPDYPCGSAVLSSNYYVLFTKYGLGWMCDFSNDYSWTRIVASGLTGMTWGCGINDPKGSGQVYAPKFLVDPANPGAATGSKICRLETMILPAQFPSSPAPNGYTPLCDPDTNAKVNATLETKAYTFSSSSMKRFQKIVFTGACNAPLTIVNLKSGLDPAPLASEGSFYLGNVFYNSNPSTLKELKGTNPPGGYTYKITNVGLTLGFATAFNAGTIGDDFWIDKISFNYTLSRQGRTKR